MKLYKTKLGRIINFIKNEGKFDYGSQVQVMSNDSKYSKYDKYVGQYGIVRYIDYSKKEYMFEVRFADGQMYGFNENELRLIKDEEYYANLDKFREIFRTNKLGGLTYGKDL